MENKHLYSISQIIKSDVVHNTVTYVVLVPDQTDRNGDIISADEIIKTAHEFMLNLNTKTVNINHEDWTDIPDCRFVESRIAPVDIEVDGGIIPAWSRLVGIKMPDDLYAKALSGEITGISMEGEWIRI